MTFFEHIFQKNSNWTKCGLNLVYKIESNVCLWQTLTISIFVSLQFQGNWVLETRKADSHQSRSHQSISRMRLSVTCHVEGYTAVQCLTLGVCLCGDAGQMGGWDTQRLRDTGETVCLSVCLSVRLSFCGTVVLCPRLDMCLHRAAGQMGGWDTQRLRGTGGSVCLSVHLAGCRAQMEYGISWL